MHRVLTAHAVPSRRGAVLRSRLASARGYFILTELANPVNSTSG